jgi:rsbT antagonist protein RsbS
MDDGQTPVAILHQGSYLVVSIRAALDDDQLDRFRQGLSEAIGRRQTRGVLIDVSELDVLDSFGSRTFRDIAEMARLRGATAVIVGVQPDLAMAMAHLGIDSVSIPTALDLEEGLDVVDNRRPREPAQSRKSQRDENEEKRR